MSLDVFIKGGLNGNLTAHVHRLSGNPKHAGMLVLTEPFIQFDPAVVPFLNDTVGAAMNQNVAFTDTPEGIHDGTDSALWTGAAVAGTWDFSDTAGPLVGSNSVSLTTANNNDSATFSDGTSTDMGNYTTVTGLIQLDVYNGVNNTISFQFLNNAVNVGNSIDLDTYIDTALLGSAQAFAIPKADFGISLQTVDQINIVSTRTGGARPTFRLDTWQIEQTGSSLVFKVVSPQNTRFHVHKLRFTFVDGLTGTVSDGTMPGLSYDQLLGVAALTNGVVFQRVQGGKVILARTLRQLSDFLQLGSVITNLISDGTDTLLTMEVPLAAPVILEPGEGNFLSMTVSDNLSDLILFNGVALGAIEV